MDTTQIRLTPPDRAEVQRRQVRYFGLAITALAKARGDEQAADRQLHFSRALPEIRDLARAMVRRAAVPAFEIGADPGSALLHLEQTAAAWLGSLAPWSIFDRIIADGATRTIPLAAISPVATVASAATAGVISEGQPLDVTNLVVTRLGDAIPRKVGALVVLSGEILRIANVADFINGELMLATARATNSAFLSELYSANAPHTSSGDVAKDLSTLLGAVEYGSGSRFYYVLRPEAVKQIGLQEHNGVRTFANVGPMGGSILPGIMCLPCAELGDGEAILFDAAAVAAAPGTVIPEISSEASLEMDSAATNASGSGSPSSPTGTTLVSMFQSGSVAMKALRWASWALLRSSAAASLSDTVYAGGSP